jgi:hypothetical protein
MAQRRSFLIVVASAAMLLAGCDKLGLSTPAGPGFKGVDITGADYKFSLPDQDGQTRTPADFKGKVTAVFFGYTQCPDVCPTALAVGAQRALDLGQLGHGGGADVGALGVAEEHHRHLALEVAQGARLAVLVGQGELARIARAGQIDAVERLIAAGDIAAGQCEREEKTEQESQGVHAGGSQGLR